MISARISKRAERDLTGIENYIAANNPQAAERVRQALLDTADLLANNSDIGSNILNASPRHAQTRWFLVPRFHNYLIFYQPFQDTIVVLRFLHAAQDWTRFFAE